MGLAGIILAAGESTRMGRDKALLPWPPSLSPNTPSGGTLLSAAIKALSDYCDLVIVVAGKNETALRPVIYGCGAFLALNPNPDLGQFSSLQVGLHEVLNQGRDAAMVTLVDRPPPQSTSLKALSSAFANRNHDVWSVVPEYQGKHGHPILIGREMIEAFLKAPATSVARDIEHANQQRILYVPVSDSQVTANIDTPEQYASIQSDSGAGL
jgi:molybdenum cofactor cytidylyltransferase